MKNTITDVIIGLFMFIAGVWSIPVIVSSCCQHNTATQTEQPPPPDRVVHKQVIHDGGPFLCNYNYIEIDEMPCVQWRCGHQGGLTCDWSNWIKPY